MRSLIEAFVRDHIEFFLVFINPALATLGSGLGDKALRRNEAELLAYFEEVENPALKPREAEWAPGGRQYLNCERPEGIDIILTLVVQGPNHRVRN